MRLEARGQSRDLDGLYKAGTRVRIILGEGLSRLSRGGLQNPEIPDRRFAVILRQRAADQHLGKPAAASCHVLPMRIAMLFAEFICVRPMAADHEPVHGVTLLRLEKPLPGFP